MKRLITSAFIAAALLHVNLTASQDNDSAQPIISAKLKCLSMEGEMSGIDLLLETGKRMPIAMGSAYISEPYIYHGPAKLIFTKALPKPDTETKATKKTQTPEASSKPEVLATLELPASGGDFLLLFSGNTESKLNVLAVPFSSTDVPAGSCLVWNITPRTLGLSLSGQRVIINPSERQLVKPQTIAENYFDLRIFDEYQGKVRPLVGGPHFLAATSRQILFIVEKTAGQAPILIRTIEELPELTKHSQVAINH